MVQANDVCAACGGPLRREADDYLICVECDRDRSITGGDEMWAPVQVERPGMFSSWRAFGLFLLFALAVCGLCVWAVSSLMSP